MRTQAPGSAICITPFSLTFSCAHHLNIKGKLNGKILSKGGLMRDDAFLHSFSNLANIRWAHFMPESF